MALHAYNLSQGLYNTKPAADLMTNLKMTQTDIYGVLYLLFVAWIILFLSLFMDHV